MAVIPGQIEPDGTNAVRIPYGWVQLRVENDNNGAVCYHIMRPEDAQRVAAALQQAAKEAGARVD